SAAFAGAASGTMLRGYDGNPQICGWPSRSDFRLIGIRNRNTKGHCSQSFACSPKRKRTCQERDRRPGARRPRRPTHTSVKVDMPRIVLTLTRPPSDTSAEQTPQSAGPPLCGTGNTDYLCGNCGFVIASGIGPGQLVAVDTAICSACGAENEF